MQIRDFPSATGTLGAVVLAQFADAIRPLVRTLKGAETQVLRFATPPLAHNKAVRSPCVQLEKSIGDILPR